MTMTAMIRGCQPRSAHRPQGAARRASRALAVLSVLLTLGACQSTGSSPVTGHDARTERLHERMAMFREAFAKADVAVLEGMLAPNYTHTNDRSAPLPRARWLEGMAQRRATTDSGESKITQFTTDNVTLNVSGDTAVGTGVAVMRGTRNGSAYALRINFTQVWAWNGKDWYRVAFHDTYEPLKE
jgi:ketosteroid isomerase-like protein